MTLVLMLAMRETASIPWEPAKKNDKKQENLIGTTAFVFEKAPRNPRPVQVM